MEATNDDMTWARAKLRWVLERIALRLEFAAAQKQRLAERLRAVK